MARLLASFSLVACAVSAFAQSRIETEITLDLASKFIGDGVNLGNAPSFQPGVAFTAGRFTLGFWGNIELNGWNEPNYASNRRLAFTEIDSWLEYAGHCKGIDWTAGVVDYQFPGTGYQQYQDMYMSASAPNIWGSPSLTLFRGSRAFTGAYAVLEASHAVGFSGRDIEFGASISYGDARSNGFFYDNAKAGFGYLHLSAQTEVGLGPNWTLTPSLHYSTLLSRGHLAGEPRRSNVWFQLGLKTAF